MAVRPVYVPVLDARPAASLVAAHDVDFDWHPGFSVAQKRRSIDSLHLAAKSMGLCRSPLEISSKSESALGRALSAFDLRLHHPNGCESSVESAFQASKIFANAGPFVDLLSADSRCAKTDPRLRASGPLRSFEYFGESWALQPQTAFYDFLYLTALEQHPDLLQHLPQFDAFTDIEFNPHRSVNCQAKAAAIARAALSVQGVWDDSRALAKREN